MGTIAGKRLSVLSEAETRLVQASSPRNVVNLTPTQLRSRIQRARRLKEKYEDQARRLSRTRAGRVKSPRTRKAGSSEVIRRKARYFAETQARFERRLAKLEQQAKRPTATRKRAASKTPARRRPSTRTVARAAPAARTARRKLGGAVNKQRYASKQRAAEASARGRRVQARRDSRQ